VRIAKVALRTPSPVPASLAACLQPQYLYLNANPFVSDPGANGAAPQLLSGGVFNPLAVLIGSGVPNPANAAHNFLGNQPSPSTTSPAATDCNAGGGPLYRDPFNVQAKPGGSGLSNILNTGAAVGVSGNISTKIQAEVIVGNYTG